MSVYIYEEFIQLIVKLQVLNSSNCQSYPSVYFDDLTRHIVFNEGRKNPRTLNIFERIIIINYYNIVKYDIYIYKYKLCV